MVLRNNSYFGTAQELDAKIAGLLGKTKEEVAASFQVFDARLGPTFDEMDNDPRNIERICQCCGEVHFVSLRLAESIVPDSKWNLCTRCIDYASSSDLSLPEEERFPVRLPR